MCTGIEQGLCCGVFFPETTVLKTVHSVPVQEALALASRPGLTVKKAAALQQNQRPILKLEDRRRKRMQEVLMMKKVWR